MRDSTQKYVVSGKAWWVGGGLVGEILATGQTCRLCILHRVLPFGNSLVKLNYLRLKGPSKTIITENGNA